MSDDRIVRRKEVVQRTGLCKSSIYLLESKGEFPQRVQLSAKAVGWRDSQLRQWIESRGIACNKK